MSEPERPLVEEILDYAVYAPVGLALMVLEDLPKIVDRGKSVLGNQIGVARFAGKLAFGQLRRTIDEALKPSRPVVTDAEGHDGPPHDATTSRVAGEGVPPTRSVDDHGPAGSVEDLAIPGYATLAASQVVSRLDSLNSAELAAVRAYEQEHRGRRTILARIDQLERERDAA